MAAAETATTVTAAKSEAAVALSEEVRGLVNEDDVRFIIGVQEETKEKLRASVAALSAFNDHSASELAEMASELERYTKIQRAMKKDLDEVFYRLRAMHASLAQKFPQHCPAPIAEEDD